MVQALTLDRQDNKLSVVLALTLDRQDKLSVVLALTLDRQDKLSVVQALTLDRQYNDRTNCQWSKL